MTERTTMLRAVLTATVLCLAAGAAGAGQDALAGGAPQAPSAGPSAQAPPAKPAPPDVFTYNPEGRRDPFVSLLFRGADAKPPREIRPDGLPGLLIGEVSLRGILKDKMGYVAMVAGPDNKTHIIRGDDKLFDGSVKAITADSVIFSQDVNDPLSLVKQREVRKYLRSTQEGK
jgi:type IV pilus assembly protein PilP